MKNKISKKSMDKYIDGKLVEKGKTDEPVGEAINFRWWNASDDDIANQIAGTIKFIQNNQHGRMEQLTKSTRLYGNSQFSVVGHFSAPGAVTASPASDRISFNLVAAVTDTLVSHIAKNKVTPVFITNGGDWDVQQKAADLSKFIEGMFYAADVHRKGTYAFRDACVWGSGLLKVYEEEDEVCADRALPHELVVDIIESFVAKPRQKHQIRFVDRDVLKDLYSEDEDAVKAIEEAMPANYQDIGGAGTAADLVAVSESWRLPSGKKSKNGLHVICVGDKKLTREPYEKDYFPFPKVDYSKRLFGYWGQGVPERLQNLQSEINRLMILDQRSRWMMGSFKVLVENGSKVVSQHLNNDVGTIIHYSGEPPQYITPPAIDPENEAKLDSLIAKGFQQEGVSQLSASSMKPMGLDSGKALRTYNDIEADRQLFIGQEMETFYLEVAKQMIECAKDIYKRRKTFKVLFPSTTFIETIDWKDIKLEENQYVMKAFPMSSLADDLSGRIQEVQELAQAGYISPRTARKLLRMPDLEMADSLANAAEDLLHKIFEEMLKKGEYRGPEPYWDLVLAKQLVLEYYNYADFHNAPQDKLDLLQLFNEQLDDLTGVNAPQVNSMPLVPPAAMPAAPPVSQLLPNQPGAMNAQAA